VEAEIEDCEHERREKMFGFLRAFFIEVYQGYHIAFSQLLKGREGPSPVDFLSVDSMCSFDVGIGSRVSGRDEMVFIAEESALEGEGMYFIDMRMKSPGKFHSIVRLDHFERKRIEEADFGEEIDAGTRIMMFVDHLVLDTGSNINGCVLVNPAILLSEPFSSFVSQLHVLHIDLKLFTGKVFGSFVGAGTLSFLPSFCDQSFAFENLVNTTHRDMDGVLVPEHEPDMISSTFSSLTNLNDELHPFLRIGLWIRLRTSGVSHEP